MTEHRPTTPDEAAAFQEELNAAHARISDLEHQLEQTCTTAEGLQRQLACLKEEYLALKRLMFGPRRERLPDDPNQQHLFDADAAPCPPPDVTESSPAPPRKRRKRQGRGPVPENLPRTVVTHDVPPGQRHCDCGREKACIGQDVTEVIEYEPGKLFVVQNVYPKYACSRCKDGVASAERSASPIAGGLAGPGLLAHVIVSKFAVHIPLYRQQDELARAGMFLARSTLCGWVGQCAERFRPLVDLMRERLLQGDVINADETTVPVLDPTRDATRTGSFTAYIGPAAAAFTVYDYQNSRSRAGPAAFLKGFHGFLQTDAGSVYEAIVASSGGQIVPVGCWAHARRNFYDARINQPREAHYVLALVEQLYEIEDEIRLFGSDQRRDVRVERSRPLLDRVGKYLREQQPGALPKSQYGQAIGYALNHWDELARFTEDGRLEIDNNVSERTLRICAIGRKNWLFVGGDEGGRTAALCFSILASAKRHHIEPFAYVRDLLIRLPAVPSQAELESLLPDVWIAAHPDAFLKHRRDEAESAAAARRRRRVERRASGGVRAAKATSSPPSAGGAAPPEPVDGTPR